MSSDQYPIPQRIRRSVYIPLDVNPEIRNVISRYRDSLRSSRIKATSLAEGISCENRLPLSSSCSATYYSPFRASRGANRDSTSSHPALRNSLNYHLESRVVRDLRNRTIVSPIGKRGTNWYDRVGSGGRSRRNIYVREPPTREHLDVGYLVPLRLNLCGTHKKKDQ